MLVKKRETNWLLIAIIVILFVFWMFILLISVPGCSPSKEANEYYESIKDSINYDDEIDSLYNIYFNEDSTNIE